MCLSSYGDYLFSFLCNSFVDLGNFQNNQLKWSLLACRHRQLPLDNRRIPTIDSRNKSNFVDWCITRLMVQTHQKFHRWLCQVRISIPENTYNYLHTFFQVQFTCHSFFVAAFWSTFFNSSWYIDCWRHLRSRKYVLFRFLRFRSFTGRSNCFGFLLFK